jgi:hypothetical protein
VVNEDQPANFSNDHSIPTTDDRERSDPMPFSQDTILSVSPPQLRGSQVFISWSSSSTAETWFQVYVNQRLAWTGHRCSAWVPIPPGPVRIDIGAVGPGEQDTDFSASLPTGPIRRVQITWQSGTYTGDDLEGFHVYGSSTPGSAVDYSTTLADIKAYSPFTTTDGFGLGGFGSGGFGQSASNYSWTSSRLAAGTWTFAIVPYDAAGNQGVAQTTTVTITAPPREPAAFAGTSTRLRFALNGFGQVGFGSGGFGLPAATLSWNPSPP